MIHKQFELKTEYSPAGDQPKAIKELVGGFNSGNKDQTLLGVTGSGKTFTAANVIQALGMPTLVIAHNKTLAAQLAQEYRDYFPNNAVHYFVSYYDYYQPEAYMPVTDTYIEKEAQINEEIDRLRHASTQALLTRSDVIIVASVSCIYGLGSPEEYMKEHMEVRERTKVNRKDFIRKLISIHYTRTNADLSPGRFRVVGNTIEIMPVNENTIYRFEIAGGEIFEILKIDPTTSTIIEDVESFFLFPAKHFVASEEDRVEALKRISNELEIRLVELKKAGKNLEAERLKRRTGYDMALIREVGYCNGIENYSRHMAGREEGEAPDTLLAYFPRNPDGTPAFLTIIDESHVTVPQIGGMFAGDRSRKVTLVDNGFRLPSAKDNRPLTFDEFRERVGQVLYTTATPADFERENSSLIAEQIIRPTGLVDPILELEGVVENKTTGYPGQVASFINTAEKEIKKGGRVIATTLTKRMAEDLSEYLKERKIKAEYLHSEIKTVERIEILTAFRKGEFDCVVGVNLLREGLDLPEVTFIGILDADKEGFLRSVTSLIQIIGRAARNSAGHVTLYADKVTKAMKNAMDETERRRNIQLAYNKKHKITPVTIKKRISDITDRLRSDHDKAVQRQVEIDRGLGLKPKELLKQKKEEMNKAVEELDFETAALIRDEIRALERDMEEEKK